MKTLLLFSIISILTITTFAQQSFVVSDNVPNTESMYYFHGRKVARTPNGLLMVVWTTPLGQGGRINYSIYDKDFQIWSPPATIASTAYQAKLPAIAADELGNIHACWQEKPTSSGIFVIMYSKFNGISWTTPVKVSLYDTKACDEASIEVDSNNNPWIVYNNDGAGVGSEYVYVVKSIDNGAIWSSTADKLSSSGSIGSSTTNGRCTLAAGPNGKMVAIWHDGQPWDNNRREIFVNQYDGTSWQGEVMISDTTTVDRGASWYPTIAIDKDANIYALYHTNDNPTNTTPTRFVIFQKKTWAQPWTASTSKILHSETAGDLQSTSAVCDEDGVIHFAFRKDLPVDTTGIDGIYYMFSKNQGDTWSQQIRLGRENHDGGYGCLANRVRKAYGIDIAFRESVTPLVNDEATQAIIYSNIPYSLITSVEEEFLTPTDYELLINYPNPFNPSTMIEYKIAEAGLVKLTIYDILGKEVKTLVNSFSQAGSYKIKWNGVDSNNKYVASGVYLARLRTERSIKTIKMQLLK